MQGKAAETPHTRRSSRLTEETDSEKEQNKGAEKPEESPSRRGRRSGATEAAAGQWRHEVEEQL